MKRGGEGEGDIEEEGEEDEEGAISQKVIEDFIFMVLNWEN